MILNFQFRLSVYDRAFTAALRALQQTYNDRSTPIGPGRLA